MTTNNSMEFGEEDLISLGEKLAALDLTEPEQAALAALISDDDVVGFGRFDLIGGIRVGLRAGHQGLGVRGPAGEPGIFGIRGPSSDPGNKAPKPGRL